MTTRARPANPGGIAVGVVYLAIAMGVYVLVQDGSEDVVGVPGAAQLALAGAVAVGLGWTRSRVRWTEVRDRRRRVTVRVLLALTALTLVLWTFDEAVSHIG